VRAIAERIGLPNAAKKDSTGICFIGERNFREFLERYLPRDPGEMKTPEGRVVGQHQGLMYYTLGQRQGLGIGGQKDGSTDPWFVAAKDMASNTLIVVQGHEHPLLKRSSLGATQLSWISGVAPDSERACTAKTRYRQTDAPCHVTTLVDDTLELLFDSPQWAVTPGQSVVLYDGDKCLGGGIIT
jgi:tRNA-specific 2-thiouridylase